MTFAKEQKSTIQTRFKSLFEFLNAYNDLRAPVVQDVSNQIATLWLHDLPSHPMVKLHDYVEIKRNEEVGEDFEADLQNRENDILLEVTRPSLAPCPKPPVVLSEWLIPGWTKLDRQAEVRVSKNKVLKGETIIEKFEESDERKKAFKEWNEIREKWVKNEQPTWEALKLFEKIYELYGLMDREGDRVELVLGEGVIEFSEENAGFFRHPVLLRRLELEFRPERKNPQFIVRRKEQPSELCVDFLRTLPEIDTHQLVRCNEELSKLGLDPLGHEDTTGFLRRLVQGLFPNGGQYVEDNEEKPADMICLHRNPVIFIRQRKAGLGRAIQLILEDVAKRIQSGEEFSVAMMQILGIEHEEPALKEEEIEVPVYGNEDEEILLSKPANQEQLQIAKQLAYRSTVLVQGPPGTGKTHTIANLIGHLLSQGKRVLVTAQTPKALKVLRREIVKDIQSLCVSVLQKEKQNLEELQQSVREISVKLSQDEARLEKEIDRIISDRTKVLKELRLARQKLFDAREDEIREIVFGGKGIRPIEAAKLVRDHKKIDDWIPGPVNLGIALPITHEEVAVLYRSNEIISVQDEKELNSSRPDLTILPSGTKFKLIIDALNDLKEKEVDFGKDYWEEGTTGDNFDGLVHSAKKAIEFFSECEPWQLEAVQAGRDGETSSKPWLSLSDFIERSWRTIQELQTLVVEYGPTVSSQKPLNETLSIIDEIVNALKKGNSLGLVAKISKRHWFQFLEEVKIAGKTIDLKNKDHFLAVQALLKTASIREELCLRWERQMVKGGAPGIDKLGDKPEQVCRQFVSKINNSLDWHKNVWAPLENALESHGFKWLAYLESTKPGTGENAQLLRLQSAILGDFNKIIEARSNALKLQDLLKTYDNFKSQLPKESNKEGSLGRQIRQSFHDKDSKKYISLYEELVRLKGLEQDLEVRKELLKKVAKHAPAWATSIQNRVGQHGAGHAPGNPGSAWEWRQIFDELERRAFVSLEELQERIEVLNKHLLQVTSVLVEKQTWLKQLQTVSQEEKRALNAYATLQSKKTKSGNGKKDAVIRAAAQKEMEAAKGAVPVWIMPLNEVVENFNPLNTRFDVVIIDEASQSDPLAMFALYLGKQTIVVGDDEQVTPTTPGIEAEEIMKLIRTYLENVPHKEFYDGETSIYDFAKTAFGNVIRLVEHFRCAPDIISFSNSLSYGGEIKPLREENSIALKPHVVPHRVEGVVDENKVNKVEAQTIAALICAAVEQPEYKNKTFGVVSLLGGGRQSEEVEGILRAKLSPDIYQQREILCGSPAHFQGDQRDVMFLSMVDSPAEGPLNLRDADANRKMYKKRYNVAASRAKDQMWLVYSLNHETDLKPGDIRKRLIEHMLDPKSWQREIESKVTKAESVFEEQVMKKLIEKGFKIQPQYNVGAYRIDMVVSGNGKKVGIECDGEKWHGPEKLQEDMERQAILERLGWKFIRIRGSLFFRDPDRAIDAVFKKLDEMNITAENSVGLSVADNSSELLERVRVRAQELQNEWNSQPALEEVKEVFKTEIKLRN